MMVFKRSIKNRTNYKKRKKMIVSRMPALYVKISNKNVYAQIIMPAVRGDRTVTQANSKELQKAGWVYGRKNFPAAYLVGLLIGKRAIKGGLSEVIFYAGNNVFRAGTKLTAVIRGAVEAGLKVRCDNGIFPADDAINAERIIKYATSLKAAGYKGLQFSSGTDKAIKEAEMLQSLKTMIMKKGELQ